MKELVTRGQADVFFLGILVLGLIVTAVAGLLAKRRGTDPVPTALLWGGPLVLIGLLWRIYNAITDRVGLDSVVNLAANAVLFIVIGAACGIGWTWLAGRRQSTIEKPPEEH